jgi:hypothetical protein
VGAREKKGYAAGVAGVILVLSAFLAPVGNIVAFVLILVAVAFVLILVALSLFIYGIALERRATRTTGRKA